MAPGVNDDDRLLRSSEDHTADARLPAAATSSSRRGSRKRSGSPHSLKFLAVTAALVGIALGAIAVAIAIVPGEVDGRSEVVHVVAPDGGVAGERDIANAVAPCIAPPCQPARRGDAQNFSAPGRHCRWPAQPEQRDAVGARRDTAVYNLCGLGPNCAVVGQAVGRAATVARREAFELSLYTFKYDHNVQNVVSILPPGNALTVTTAKLTPKPPATSASPPRPATVHRGRLPKRSLQSSSTGRCATRCPRRCRRRRRRSARRPRRSW